MAFIAPFRFRFPKTICERSVCDRHAAPKAGLPRAAEEPLVSSHGFTWWMLAGFARSGLAWQVCTAATRSFEPWRSPATLRGSITVVVA
jgi:hypothetical protein